MIARLAVLAAALALQGCLSIPAATLLSSGVAALGTGVTAIHDCHLDGGCKELPLPP